MISTLILGTVMGLGWRPLGNEGTPMSRGLWRRTLAPILLAATVFTAGAILACSGYDGDGSGESGRLRVVASTGILAHFAEQIVGDDADVVAVIPAGADAHSFSASTGDIRNISAADVVIVNGYNLEEGALGTIFEHIPDDARLVIAATGIDPLEGGRLEGDEEDEEEGEAPADAELAVADGDPHMWLAVPNAIVYVHNISDGLAAADPDNAAAYRERTEAYLAELQALDEEVRSIISGIPPERRVLIVYHDAFQYLAAEYGLELAAAVLPASPSQQASAAAVAGIIEIVTGREVRAVYREPQFAADALEAIAEEANVEVLTLYSSAFTDDVNSFVELMRANARALAEGLGGG